MSRSNRYKSEYQPNLEHQSTSSRLETSSSPPFNMKCIAAIVLLALFGLALAKPLEEAKSSIETAEPTESLDAARNKRGLLLGAAYTAPLAAAYTAPVATYASYSYPYAYAAYSSYPYYTAGYAAPYYVA